MWDITGPSAPQTWPFSVKTENCGFIGYNGIKIHLVAIFCSFFINIKNQRCTWFKESFRSPRGRITLHVRPFRGKASQIGCNIRDQKCLMVIRTDFNWFILKTSFKCKVILTWILYIWIRVDISRIFEVGLLTSLSAYSNHPTFYSNPFTYDVGK